MGSPITRPCQTVAGAMLTTPKTHGLEITVSDAETAFTDAHVHMLLLTRRGVLHGTLLRADLDPRLDPRHPALELAALAERTIGPDQPIDEALRLLSRGQTRRLAVTDSDSRLLGLLCFKRASNGFCSESDVLARMDEQPR
ncbi:putative transcriptional regulator [Aeromicrobium panaciterrae]|uniref:Transcriptional regulator n=1 Tax=Aeromicrobium panaciterrae TaxID=363861 RepID=A0ABU1UM86_9ACTN|nr:CBS domain-containing protein [Aeromicrobium panaciterrae]MDR7086298.1 putative transcriptional regulator [Aeromicrobium panaciterrae]